MELHDALAFAGTRSQSVLVTVRRNSRPQLSNVLHHADGEVVRVSITTDRAKYKNLVRDPWAALHVTSDDFWSYVVLEGPAELSPVAADPGDAVVDELVEYYRALRGEHPDWDEYRQAQVDQRRVVLRLRPDHAYGIARSRG